MTKAEILDKKYKTLLIKGGIDTPLRKAHFWAQLDHESGLIPKSENLNYSIKRLLEIFKSDFDINRDKWLSPQEKEKVKEIIGSPERIANFVYANQNGNGSESTGDGYKYRGRFFIQTTGKANYIELQKATNIDFATNPDKHLNEVDSLVAALHFWKSRNINKFSDRDDVRGATKVINGGVNGLSDRIDKVNYYKTIFK